MVNGNHGPTIHYWRKPEFVMNTRTIPTTVGDVGNGGAASSPVFLIIIQYVRYCSEQQEGQLTGDSQSNELQENKQNREMAISIISLVWIHPGLGADRSNN